jgi:hypothetical protein
MGGPSSSAPFGVRMGPLDSHLECHGYEASCISEVVESVQNKLVTGRGFSQEDENFGLFESWGFEIDAVESMGREKGERGIVFTTVLQSRVDDRCHLTSMR